MTGILINTIQLHESSLNVSNDEDLDEKDPSLNPMIIASTLSVLVGIIQLVIGTFKLDFISLYFSDAMISGYLTAGAFHVLTSQIDDILGIELEPKSGSGYLYNLWYQIIFKLDQINLFTLLPSIICYTLLLINGDLINPFINKHLKIKCVIPGELIMVGSIISSNLARR